MMKRISSGLRAAGTRSRPWVVRHGILAGLLLALPAFSPVPAVPEARAGTGVSLARGWQHVLMHAARLRAFGLTRVVAGGSGLVATEQPPYRFWASTDGRVWRLLPPHAFGHEVPLTFYAAGRLLVIAGYAGPEPRIWASGDGGATWHESSAHFRITALAAGGDGAVAFSQTDVSQPIRVWTSPDGLAWRRLPQQPGVFASAQVYSVASGIHGLVAGGAVVRPGMGRAGIWTSPHGRIWRQVPNTGGIFGNGKDGSQVYHVVDGPRSILAIGQRLRTRAPVAWASPDGVHWQRRTLPFGAGNVDFGQVVALQSGFVALTHERTETAVWSSANGLTWARVGSDELFGGTARVWGATDFRGGIAAVGTFARHPQPACRTREVADLQTFRAAAFLWSPSASVSAPPPAIDWSDPRTLKLLPSDLGDLAAGAISNGSAYVDLCGADPALGPHRAYQLYFQDPSGEQFTDSATSIVTASASASRAAFRLAGRLIIVDGVIQQKQEFPADVRIGEGTRLFRLQIRTDAEGSTYTYWKFAVAWRAGPVIGVVVTSQRNEAILLAERQFAHLKHPWWPFTDDLLGPTGNRSAPSRRAATR